MFLETRKLFIMNDRSPDVAGAMPADEAKAKKWNKLGYGVFWAMNDFDGERLAKNTTKINAWFFENDTLSKPQQLALLDMGLYPSLVVESKRSFQAYFFAREGDQKSFTDIQSRLIHFYGGDEKIKDPLRLMRAPGYKHMKDISDPFDVKVIWRASFCGCPIRYSPRVMQSFYKLPKKKEATPTAVQELEKSGSLEYFDLLYNMDHEKVLKDFSGTAWVKGEKYTFKDNRNGKHNILVNGKSTHAFIDAEGRIGAVNGGPTIYQWLKWFGHDYPQIRKATMEVLGV